MLDTSKVVNMSNFLYTHQSNGPNTCQIRVGKIRAHPPTNENKIDPNNNDNAWQCLRSKEVEKVKAINAH